MPELTETLCLKCGLCCNGVLFADVRKEHGDSSPLFEKFGSRVAQPCPAFNSGDCRCAIYSERPARCRKFECKQLLAVRAGKKSAEAALKKIRRIQKLVVEIENLLEQLDFNKTDLPIRKRFQNCQRAAEHGRISTSDLDCLADLQLAAHRLNHLLARDFHA